MACECIGHSTPDICHWHFKTEKFNFNNTFDKHITLQHLKNFETYVNNYIDDEIAPKVRGSFLDTIKKYHNKELSTRSITTKIQNRLRKNETLYKK